MNSQHVFFFWKHKRKNIARKKLLVAAGVKFIILIKIKTSVESKSGNNIKTLIQV